MCPACTDQVVHKSTEDIRVKVLREVEILYACKDRRFDHYSVKGPPIIMHASRDISNVLHLFEFFEDADKYVSAAVERCGCEC